MMMALLVLLLQTGLVLGSNYGYVEWSENHRDENPPALSSAQSIDASEQQQQRPATERTVVAHKIEEDLPRVVTAFLHSGDSSALRQVKCSRRYELSSLRGGARVASHYSLHGILETVTHAANFLNTILQANSSREDTWQRDLRWYRALVRRMLEGDPKIHRAAVSFRGDSPAPGTHVSLQATRSEQEVLLQESGSPDRSGWVNGRRADPKTGVHLLDKEQIRWSAPYLECDSGAFVPFWLLTLSAGFYGLERDSGLRFRGAVRVDVNLQDVDIDQCSDSGWFAGTHRCNLTSMECTPIAGHGFVLDKYKCQCRRGFYHPSRVALNGFKTTERGSRRDDVSDAAGKCLPCRAGCPYCRDDTPCVAREDGGLRLAAASFQGLCVLLDLASMVALYHFRRSKSIRTSGFILLEAILFGALLLYFPVMILYFHPSVFRCILLRWVRLLGFAIMYGTVVLKLYRASYVTSWRVLRMLTIILSVVSWFLVAWTSAVCQNPEPSRALIAAGLSSEGLRFSMCLLDRWDYMMALAELLFLLWGVYLCYAVRSIHSAFHEPRYMTVAIYNELLLSAVFHLIRFSVAPGLHPDWMLMLIFAHTHLTVTVTVGVLLVPKFLSKGTQARDDIATEVYEEELDMGRSGSYLNNSITSAWSEHSLDPDDIRDELKKLYAQLEVYKRKKMLANNPHLQKKRNSKKGLGRTLMKRITEIPETMHLHRQCSREDGSEHGGDRGTLRRNHTETSQHGKPREDSLKNKVISLQRSLSYDHVCDRDDETGSQSGSAAGDKTTAVGNGAEISLLGSLVGRKHCKKQLEPAAPPSKLEPARSAESVPLFWKSASVHNLTHEKKPVHLRTSIMQKSLSVIASAKEKMPGLGNKTQSAEDASKKGLKGQEGRTLAEVDETPEHYPKMIVSQSVEYSKTPMKMGIMKQQVSGSQPSICSETGRNLYDVSEVAPWEMEEPRTPSEAKTQKHVSIAPEQTDAGRRGSSSSGVGKCSRSQQKQKTGQSPSNRRRSKDRGGQREESRETRKSRGPRSPLPLKPDVSAWDFDVQPMLAGVSESISPDRIRRKKSVTPTDGKPKALRSDRSKSTGSLLQPPSSMVEICPWDYGGAASPEQEKTCSSPSARKKKRKGSCSSNHKADKDKGREKTRERRSSSSKPPAERRRVSQSSECGGAVSERRCGSAKDPEGAEVRRAEINGTFAQTKTSSDRKKERYREAAVGSGPKMADVCPWDVEDQDPAERA
ncbi:metabotropic glycine receptor isoform X2 [Phycodurus eques]|uniref:metabotropic glycine receptor isoform X2 n=1 Tax=Phycodurus eques TaxID=693459 RepID=UPI002ACD6864|nr:metabotropic glycine receptor isoform X2 [Phycodurus eques]